MVELLICFIINAALSALPVLLLARFKRWSVRRSFAYAGALYITLYGLAVTIPFHFQGYSTLQTPQPGDGLGWTRWWPVALFAYFYTFKATAFAWLTTALLMVTHGEFSTDNRLNPALKSCALLAACWMLTELDRYAETINMVLE